MKKILLPAIAVFAITFAGCDKGSESANLIQLTTTDQTVAYADKFQIEATSDTPITYTSEDEYHASVSESGLVNARYVGETNIVLTNGEDTKRIKITVRPESNLYPEADLTFGMMRSAVKAKFGAPTSETDTALGWTGYSNNAPVLMCTFDDSDRLDAVVYMVKTAYSSELGTFLAERYVPIDISGENYAVLCVNALKIESATMFVGADVYNLSYWMVAYMPYTHSGTRAGINHSDIMKSLNELMEKMQSPLK